MKQVVRCVGMGMLAGLFGVVAIFGLVACTTTSAEDVIRNGLEEELSMVKNLDDEFIESMESSLSLVDLDVYGITVTEFCEAWLDGFDYSIDDVTVNGEDAVATVTLTCRPLFDALDVWYEAMSDESLYDMSTDELYEYAGQSLIEAVASLGFETTTVELTYELSGDEWYATNDSQTAIAEALYGEY